MQPNIVFDFATIGNLKDFYTIAREKLALPEYFGNNLDALWDCITGDIALPVSVEFINLSLNQLEVFADLIAVFEEADAVLEDNFTFSYSLSL